MFIYRLLLLLLAVPALVVAAPVAAPGDSLRNVLRQPGLPDTQRVLALDELCWQLNRTDLAQARQYGETGLHLARRIGYRRGEARLLNDLGTAALYSGDRLAAQRYYAQGVTLVRRTGPPRLLGHLLMGLANVAVTQADYRRAVALYAQARAAYAANHPPAVADEALILYNTGLCYEGWGRLWEATRALSQTRRLVTQLGDSSTLANVLVALARVQRHPQPDSALRLLRQAVGLARLTHNRLAEVTALNQLGEVLLHEKQQPAAALAVLLPGARLARQYRAEDQLAQALETIAIALRRQGQPAAAFDTLRAYQRLHDTLAARSSTEAIARQQARFEVAQQRARIEALDRQRRQALAFATDQQKATWGLVVVAFLSALALALLTRSHVRLRRSQRYLVRSEAALLASNRTKDRLMSILAHDMRAPVAAFQQVGGMLRYYIRRPDPAELAEMANELEHDAAGLASLLDNLLRWARTQLGEVANRPVVLDPTVVVAVVLDLHKSLARAKRQTLQAELPVGTVRACADPDLLSTVLRNLVGNAIKFTPEGGTIVVRVRAAVDTVEFTVCDTGRGLSPAELGRLFGPNPESAPGTAGETGTGLGLSVCRQFAAMLGGELRVTSTPGQGTCFSFEVPTLPAEPSPAPPPAETAEVAEAFAGRRG